MKMKMKILGDCSVSEWSGLVPDEAKIRLLQGYGIWSQKLSVLGDRIHVVVSPSFSDLLLSFFFFSNFTKSIPFFLQKSSYVI